MNNKRLIYIVTPIIIVLLVGYFGYSYWTKTPKYALGQISKAIETHDVELFNKHVDVNTLSSRLIDDIITGSMNQNEQEQENNWSKLGQELGKGLVNLMKPRLTEMVKEQMEKYIETGDFGKPKEESASDNSFSFPEIQKRFGKNFTGLKYTKQEGKIAIVGVGILNERFNKELILELKMREKEGGYWQLVEFANVPSLIKESKKLEQDKLDQINKPIKEQMAQALAAVWIKKSSSASEYGYDRKVIIRMLLKNGSSTLVKSFTAEVQCLNTEQRLIKKLILSMDTPLPANSSQTGTWTIDANMFIKEDMTLFETPESQLIFVFVPQSIVQSNGNELKLKTSLD